MNSEPIRDFSQVESIIGYTFIDKTLLTLAFTHASCSNSNNKDTNERLEFLGDSVLDYLVGAELFKTFPTLSEGELTQKRAFIVSAETLATEIEKTGLHSFLKTAIGSGRDAIIESENVKCDLFEAILGAIVLDSNFDLAFAKEYVWKFLRKYIDYVPIDYKSKTLEYCMKYKIDCKFICKENNTNNVSERFSCSLTVKNDKFTGTGRNRKEAEKNAAKVFYNTFL